MAHRERVGKGQGDGERINESREVETVITRSLWDGVPLKKKGAVEME